MPSNQCCLVGYWYRWDAKTKQVAMTTTGGVAQLRHELESIDLTIGHDWPRLGPYSSEQEKEATKARALRLFHERFA